MENTNKQLDFLQRKITNKQKQFANFDSSSEAEKRRLTRQGNNPYNLEVRGRKQSCLIQNLQNRLL